MLNKTICLENFSLKCVFLVLSKIILYSLCPLLAPFFFFFQLPMSMNKRKPKGEAKAPKINIKYVFYKYLFFLQLAPRGPSLPRRCPTKWLQGPWAQTGIRVFSFNNKKFSSPQLCCSMVFGFALWPKKLKKSS